jgi:SAM-dependent methyltransferase
MSFINTYADESYSASYSKIEFPGCYYLAYRDLPEIIRKHARTGSAVDFGCGAGRSTRFLRGLGFDVTGIDISESMIKKARELDPDGRYRMIKDGDFSCLPQNEFDLVLSMFTFDNIAGEAWRAELLRRLANLLNDNGKIICLDSTPEMYTNEWVSFSSRDFPENARAKSGDPVRVINLDSGDRRPCGDILWTDEDYRAAFQKAGLSLTGSQKVFAREDEPYAWINETKIAPWIIYIAEKKFSDAVITG